MGALIGGVIAVVALLVIAVPTLVGRFDFFRVGVVEFVGLEYLAPEDILARLAIPTDAHILVDLAPITERARAIPGIREVRVARRWPGTLVVTLREATPVALVPVKGQLMVMDVTGTVLPWSPTRIGHSLPLAPHDSAVAGLLGRLQAADPSGYEALERVVVQGGDLWLESATTRTRVLTTAGVPLLRNVARVREWLADSALAWREIDARVSTRFFVLKETT
jgi:cell division septal protein FtsQ